MTDDPSRFGYRSEASSGPPRRGWSPFISDRGASFGDPSRSRIDESRIVIESQRKIVYNRSVNHMPPWVSFQGESVPWSASNGVIGESSSDDGGDSSSFPSQGKWSDTSEDELQAYDDSFKPMPDIVDITTQRPLYSILFLCTLSKATYDAFLYATDGGPVTYPSDTSNDPLFWDHGGFGDPQWVSANGFTNSGLAPDIMYDSERDFSFWWNQTTNLQPHVTIDVAFCYVYNLGQVDIFVNGTRVRPGYSSQDEGLVITGADAGYNTGDQSGYASGTPVSVTF